VGDYPLTMPMSTDSAVIFGRELYGEPKKIS
jgi:acetoacetate decarboxylase